jgi:serine/threonine protein kinase
MAPEILRGERYEEASDVYSFGVILWEMVSSAIPFKERSIAQITGTVGFYREKLSVPESANRQLRKIINNCLVFEKDRRPSFEHIIKYIEKIERRPKLDSTKPFVTKLGNFLN